MLIIFSGVCASVFATDSKVVEEVPLSLFTIKCSFLVPFYFWVFWEFFSPDGVTYMIFFLLYSAVSGCCDLYPIFWSIKWQEPRKKKSFRSISQTFRKIAQRKALFTPNPIHASNLRPPPLVTWIKFNCQCLSKNVFTNYMLPSCVGEATLKLLASLLNGSIDCIYPV